MNLISICFHIPRKYTKTALYHLTKGVKRPLKAQDHTHLNNSSGSLGRLPGCQQFAKKVSANHLGRHLCRPGLRHVDFHQARSFSKHALSSPLINSSQATEIFPLHPKACLPPQLIDMDVSNLRRAQQKY